MMMTYETLLFEVQDSIATVTLNRPGKLNAMNDAMLRDLDVVLGEIEQDLDIKIVVIKGAGRAFSVGQDLSGAGVSEVMPLDPRARLSVQELIEVQKRWNRRWEYIFNLGKPTIAQVHGYCLGAGCYLAMVCDLVIAAEDALFGDPSLRMGVPSSLPLWMWFISLKATQDLLYSGRYVDGLEAAKMGLANLAVPAAKLEEEVSKYARAISIPPGDGMTLLKESLNANLDIRGVGAAWRFTGEMQVMGALRQRTLPPDEFNFYEFRDKKGLKAALEERDRRFKEFGF